jgi:hypothetical protein
MNSWATISFLKKKKELLVEDSKLSQRINALKSILATTSNLMMDTQQVSETLVWN